MIWGALKEEASQSASLMDMRMVSSLAFDISSLCAFLLNHWLFTVAECQFIKWLIHNHLNLYNGQLEFFYHHFHHLAMDLPSAWCQVCVCGRTFSVPQAYTGHKRSCQKTKKRLSSALDKAKEVWQSRKCWKMQSPTMENPPDQNVAIEQESTVVALAWSLHHSQIDYVMIIDAFL